MRVDWSEVAIQNLVSIYEHIKLSSPTYAIRMVDKITRRSIQVADHPHSGRKVPEYDAEDIRELIEKLYRIIYRVKQDRIEVITVIHGARLLPDSL